MSPSALFPPDLGRAATSTPPSAWHHFWRAEPALRVYLAVGSLFLAGSLLSDLIIILRDGASPLLEVAPLVLATAAFLAQWWRTTVAFALLIPVMVLTCLGADEILLALLLPIMLVSVMATAHSRLFAVAALGVSIGWAVVQPILVGSPVGTTWFLLSLVGFGGGMGAYMRWLVAHREQDRQRIADAERRAREAAERERRILARDLHDIVAHNLTIISMQARTAQYVGTAEAAQNVLRVVGDSAKDALVDLRRMLAVLQEDGVIEPAPTPGTAATDGAATVAHLRSGADRMAEDLRLLGMEAHVEMDLGPDALNLGVRAALYRVMQEAVTNVAKHGGAGEQAWIRGFVRDGRVVLEVENSVPATAPLTDAGSSGVGLTSMQDRVEAFGGTLRAGPAGSNRWLVRAEMPRPV